MINLFSHCDIVDGLWKPFLSFYEKLYMIIFTTFEYREKKGENYTLYFPVNWEK